MLSCFLITLTLSWSITSPGWGTVRGRGRGTEGLHMLLNQAPGRKRKRLEGSCMKTFSAFSVPSDPHTPSHVVLMALSIRAASATSG